MPLCSWGVRGGRALSGFAGVAAGPCSRLPGHGRLILVDAFVVIVVGGMGSLGGAVLASFIIGELQSFGCFCSRIFLALIYMLMALVLVLKPEGLFGEAVMAVRAPSCKWWAAPGPGPVGHHALAAGPYQLRLFTEAVIFSLYAVSFNMLLGYAGLLSFVTPCSSAGGRSPGPGLSPPRGARHGRGGPGRGLHTLMAWWWGCCCLGSRAPLRL